MYRLCYLLCAQQDILEIAQYISHACENVAAAHKLLDEIEMTARRIAQFPFSYSVYTTDGPLQNTYRRAVVQSFLMLYMVDEATETVTIVRVVSARRDQLAPPY